MMMNRFCKRLLAGLICMTLTMTLIPNPAFALEEAKASTEVVALREENVKHFDMGDGTYQAISYSHPVHEKDSNGNWQDIDFGMTRKQTRGVATYTNAASGTAFAATYTQNAPLVTLSGEGTSIAMTLAPSGTNKNASTFTTQSIATANANAQVSNPQSTIRTIEDAENAKFSSTIFYNDVMPNIDLEYIVDPGTVKENIIVKAPAEEYAYLFSMDLTGLYPELLDDGSIALYNETTKEMDYAIPAPFMYDGLGNMSEDVAYTLVKIQGTYYLKVIANADWINEEGRTFPITIDPTYVQTITTVQDTYISANQPNKNNQANSRLWVMPDRIPYIYFEEPDIPDNNYLHWAFLSIYYYYFDHVSSGYVDVGLHLATQEWSQSTLTWNYCNSWSNKGLSETTLSTSRASGSQNATVDNPNLLNLDLAEAVRLWNSGTDNYGVGLRYMDTSANSSVLLASTESLYNYKPYVTYQYGPSFKMTIELLYDNGYINRYPNASQRIRNEISDLQSYYYNLLEGVEIDIGFVGPRVFDSYADNCTTDTDSATTANYEQLCHCGSCYSASSPNSLAQYHHKNISNILYRLPAPQSILNATVAYIGHKTCMIENGNCTDSNIKGAANSDFRLVAINNFDGQTLETITLIHEVGHLLGAPDHYKPDDELYSSPKHDVGCLYGVNKSTMTNLALVSICQGCRDMIEDFIEKYKF